MSEWILSSSILILIVIALRTVFKGKISLRLQYAIWGLVLLRLLIPVSFGSTNFSVANLTVPNDPPAIQTTLTPNTQNTSNVPNFNHKDIENKIQNRHEDLEIDAEVHVDAPVDIAWILKDAALIIWAIGAASVSALFLMTNIRFSKKVMHSRRAVGFYKKLEVYGTDEIDTPCLFGFLKPAIYVTHEVARDKTLLRHTVTHEATHYRHGDHIWAVLRCVCLAIHWYNPIVWWAAILSQRDAELACDEATIKQLGEGERAEYGRTLIGMTCQKRANVLITATTMIASKSGLKERIMLIAKKPKMAIYTLITVILIASIAVGCTFTGAEQNKPDADEKLREYLREYSYKQVKDRMELGEVHYIGDTENYALVYCSGMGPNLFLYRYEADDNQIVINAQAKGEYAISNGISVNHIKDGDKHIYFGTVSDYHWIPVSDSRIPINWKSLFIIDENGTEYEIEMTGKEGYLCVLDAPMEHFNVIEHEDTTGWSLTMASFLNQGYLIHEAEWYSEGPKEDTSARGEILDKNGEVIVGKELREETVGFLEVMNKELDDNKVCIAVQPTGLVSEGGAYLYIVPEDQETLLEYYLAANASAHKYTKWDSSNSRAGWWIVYQDQWWQVTEGGAMFGTDQETWDGITIDADDAKLLYEFCDAAVKEAGIGDPVRPQDITKIKSATLQWDGVHTVTNPYALQKIENWIANSSEYGSVSCWFTALLTLELENGETKTISMATDSCATWMSEGVAYGYGETTDVGINGNEEFYSLFATDIIHEKAKEGMDALAEYWVYTNWRVYSDTYSIDETFALMDMFREYAVSNPTDWIVTVALTTSRGLDGAFAEYYAGVVAALYEADPAVFSFACKQMIPEQDVNNAVNMLAYHWNITPEEARSKLEIEGPQN